ncbi:DUF4169 family protein [Falsihalocynthiibacter sp. SS001]|uniref:DUF4169 family protein n=1 Tax=Falsihalocynthiibacter sp. SS001 TaxID=3349698 RepID=UPI0036D2396A
MQKITNLSRARKQKARDEKRAQSEIATKSAGTSKAAKLLEATKNERARQMLDQHFLGSEFEDD